MPPCNESEFNERSCDDSYCSLCEGTAYQEEAWDDWKRDHQAILDRANDQGTALESIPDFASLISATILNLLVMSGVYQSSLVLPGV